MSDNETQVCPWCQTEIVWDPEIGPEDVCPHCLNELGDYRSVSFQMEGQEDEEEEAEEEDGEEHEHNHGHGHRHPGHVHSLPAESDEELDDYDEESEPDPFREKVQEILDTQLEAPECPNCRELMLFGGQVRLSGNRFDPAQPSAVDEPILPEILEMDLFVCPSCFKTETYLAEPGRIRLTQTLSK